MTIIKLMIIIIIIILITIIQKVTRCSNIIYENEEKMGWAINQPLTLTPRSQNLAAISTSSIPPGD
jgi:hypothetical protein